MYRAQEFLQKKRSSSWSLPAGMVVTSPHIMMIVKEVAFLSKLVTPKQLGTGSGYAVVLTPKLDSTGGETVKTAVSDYQFRIWTLPSIPVHMPRALPSNYF